MKLTYKLVGLPAGLLLNFMLLAVGGADAQASDARFEAQLIWATNDKTNSNPKLKAAEPEVRAKLGELPLKWEHYFEVKRQQFTVKESSTNLVAMSEKCALEVKRLGNQKVEVTLHGQKGKVCAKRTQPLPKGDMLVLGGNAPNATAWLVTLKRIE